jgi:hypothetical protein
MSETKPYPSTFEEWLTDTLDADQISDLARHGADGGWPGLTYTSDCVELYDEYEAEIWELGREMAEDLGHKNTVELFAGFNRSDMLDDPDTFKNLLVWFIAEETARRLNPDL